MVYVAPLVNLVRSLLDGLVGRKAVEVRVYGRRIFVGFGVYRQELVGVDLLRKMLSTG